MGATFVAPAIAALSAGTTLATAATVSLANSNGLSFGISGNTVTASYTVPTVTNSSATVSAGTKSETLSNLVFSNSNAFSFGLSNGTITGSYTVPSTAGLVSAVNISAGATSQNLSAFTLSNSNNVSFGLSGSTVTASASYSQSTAPSAIVAGTQTATSGTVSFADSNGISFGLAGSTRLTASYTVPSTAGLVSAVNVSAGATSNNLSALTLSNSNGVSFGLNGSTVTASVAAQTNQSVGLYAVGNTTQNSSTTLDARTISFDGLGGASVGYSNGSVQISALPAGSISAGTASASLGQVVFSNSNGISFGMSAGTITATVQPGAAAGLAAAQAGTQTATSGTIVFANSNGLTFGMSGSSQITASYTVPTVPAQISVGVSTGGNTAGDTGVFTGRVVLVGGNNITLSGSSNAGSYTLSVSGPNTVAQTNQSIGFYGVGNTTQNSSTTLDARTVSFDGLGGISVGYSNGSIQISGPQTAAQTNQTVGLYAVGNTTGQSTSTTLDARTISFDGAGIASVGYSAGSVVVSVPSPSSQTNQTVGLYAVGNTTQNSSTTLDARTLSFDGLGIISVGYSNGSVQISASQSAQTQSNVQALFDGANSISTGTARFSNANGVSFGINGQTVTASIAPRKVNHLSLPDSPWQTNFSISNASFSLQHFCPRADITATQANLLMALSGNSGSSGALTISLGVYSFNGSTLSLASSDSRNLTWTSGSQTSASSLYGGVSGTRYRTVGLASWGLSAGDYMVAAWFRTTNDGTWRAAGWEGPTIVGAVDANETNAYLPGFSTSSFTTGMMASINVTDTNFVRTGGDALKQPGVVFMGTF
jgi:hypothetical protein